MCCKDSEPGVHVQLTRESDTSLRLVLKHGITTAKLGSSWSRYRSWGMLRRECEPVVGTCTCTCACHCCCHSVAFEWKEFLQSNTSSVVGMAHAACECRCHTECYCMCCKAAACVTGGHVMCAVQSSRHGSQSNVPQASIIQYAHTFLTIPPSDQRLVPILGICCIRPHDRHAFQVSNCTSTNSGMRQKETLTIFRRQLQLLVLFFNFFVTVCRTTCA